MQVKRKIIEIDEELCNGCGQCAIACAEGALAIVEGKAKVISDRFCDGLGACIGECPEGALKIVEREADEFDEEAVEKFLAERARQDEAEKAAPAPRQCPSAGIQMFGHKQPCEQANQPASLERSESGLTHWPIQIMLVPSNAPFLQGADLLVVADCAPVAYPDFHREFLKGKAVMMGCPKFDDVAAYVDKFAKVCSNAGLKSITSVIMEVPCCSQLPMIVRKGLEKSGRNIPLQEVIITTRGKIKERRSESLS